MSFVLFRLFNSLSHYSFLYFRFPLYYFVLSLTYASFVFKALLVRCADIVNSDVLTAVKTFLLGTVCGHCCIGGRSGMPGTISFNFLFMQIVQLRFPANLSVLLLLLLLQVPQPCRLIVRTLLWKFPLAPPGSSTSPTTRDL
jgi:hypothetical protein